MSSKIISFVCMLALIGATSVSARPTKNNRFIWRANDGSRCPVLQCDLDSIDCPHGLQMDRNHCPLCSCLELMLQQPRDTGVSTTDVDAESAECPICDTFCMMGHVKDPQTGCDKCDQCFNPRPSGFGPRPDMGGDPDFGREGGPERRPRPGVVVPGLGGTEGARDCNIVCVAQWEPVCGEDGRTYSNICVKITEECRRNVKIGIRKHGVC